MELLLTQMNTEKHARNSDNYDAYLRNVLQTLNYNNYLTNEETQRWYTEFSSQRKTHRRGDNRYTFVFYHSYYVY
jgi:hypothetical protein